MINPFAGPSNAEILSAVLAVQQQLVTVQQQLADIDSNQGSIMSEQQDLAADEAAIQADLTALSGVATSVQAATTTIVNGMAQINAYITALSTAPVVTPLDLTGLDTLTQQVGAAAGLLQTASTALTAAAGSVVPPGTAAA